MSRRIPSLPLLAVALSGVVTMVPAAVRAAEVVLTFDSVPVAACWDIWSDQDCQMQIGATGPNDCTTPGSCSFSLGVGEVLFTGQVSALLFSYSGIERVEADVVEGDTLGCALLTVRSGMFPLGSVAGTHIGPTPETLVMEAPTGYEISSFSLGGNGTTVREIRLLGANLTPVMPDTWGSIKARYATGR